jgi:glutamate dehydrogenase (NAD(P)+)
MRTEPTEYQDRKDTVQDIVSSEARTIVPQFVAEVRDDSIGLLGYVVVDSTVRGRSCGGLRLFDNVSVDQLKALARGMTLKYGFSGMPQGGAKAGIVADPDMPKDQKQRLLFRFGEILHPVLRSGYYISGPDMSVEHDDIDVMMAGAGVQVPSPRREKGKKSGFFTALGVMVAVEACLAADAVDPAGITVAIEGFGAVGTSLALLLSERKRSRVVAVSTTKGALYDPRGLDVAELARLREQHGNRSVEFYRGADQIRNEDLLTLEVDVLAPCAGQYTVTEENVDRIRARYICPGANNPVTAGAEQSLARKGVVSVPYFTANCGGVLGNKMEILDATDTFIESMIREKNRDRIGRLIALARERREPLYPIAEQYALERYRGMQASAAVPSVKGRMHAAGLGLFNAGLIPSAFHRLFATPYLRRAMAGDPPID